MRLLVTLNSVFSRESLLNHLHLKKTLIIKNTLETDLWVCLQRKYKFSLVVCHDGKIYKYSVDGDEFNAPMISAALSKLEMIGYNEEIKNDIFLEKYDITLLKHEIMEKEHMKSGMAQEKAHIETSKVYNYSKEASEFYAKIKKYKKG